VKKGRERKREKEREIELESLFGSIFL